MKRKFYKAVHTVVIEGQGVQLPLALPTALSEGDLCEVENRGGGLVFVYILKYADGILITRKDLKRHFKRCRRGQ